MKPLDRRPFGFKHKGVIYCQLCRGQSVKVGRDGVLGGCIHGDMPEDTPPFDVLCLGQDHLMDFSGTALEQPVGSAHCPTPATQKRRRPRDTGGTPEGRQGVHPTPWQCTLSHACHAKAAETKGHRRDTGGTPGRTSDPLAVHIVPRLPRKSGGDQGTPEGHRRDARAYIRPLGSAHCPTPATQKRRRPRDTGGTPEGRQGVHPTPWQCTLSHACHAKAAETKGHRRDTGGTPGRTSDPLAVHIVPRLPCKSGGDQGTPEGRQGVHPTPWQCTLSHACHAKAAETKGHRRDTGGTPGRTSDPLAVHIVPRLPRKRGGDQGTPEGHRRDARAYIRPLGSAHCPTPATQKRRRPRDTGGTPGRTSDPLAVHIVPRLPRKSGGDQGTPEGRQGVHPTPWQCTLSHACHAKAAETKGHRRDTGGTPGRTSDPLAVHIVPRLPRKSGGDQGTPEGRQGVHPTPWQCTLSHACHAKAAETKGHRRDARAYIRPLAVHIVPRLPRKSGGDQARAYIRPLGSE